MSPAPALATQRSYDLHGVALALACDDPFVVRTVDDRLRAFAVGGERAAAPNALRVELLQGETLTAPAGPGRAVYDTPYGELLYFSESDVIYGELAGVRMHCAAGDGLVRIAAARLRGRDLYLATHPLLTIALMELLERRGRFAIHAGCLAQDGRGVLLAGPTGAGKSTLTIALARAGLGFLSDDVVFLGHDPGGAVRALGFSDTLGVTEQGAARFAELLPALDEPLTEGFPKRLVRIEEALPDVSVIESCEPRVLIFPRVATDEPSELTALDPRDAWLRLVPDVLLTQPAGTQSHLAALAAMLEQADTYELRSGADLDRAAQLVVQALAA